MIEAVVMLAIGLSMAGVVTSVLAAMNSSQSKDDWVKAQQHKFHKPIDVDTLMWVRNRLMRLEVEARWADRICVFEEFFPNDAIIPRI